MVNCGAAIIINSGINGISSLDHLWLVIYNGVINSGIVIILNITNHKWLIMALWEYHL